MSVQKLKLPLTGGVTINTGNADRDGSGTMGTVLTSANDGTLVERIIIKATGNTSQGMIRLFVGDGTVKQLYREIYVPELIQTDVEAAFQITLSENLILKPTQMLFAATQWSETFNVVAIATTWINCNCEDNCATEVESEINNGLVTISTGNPSLDGTGIMGTVLVAPGGLNKGTRMSSITVKALTSTSIGMIRIFIDILSGGKMLISEIPVSGMTQTSVEPSFKYEWDTDLYLNPTDELYVSTQNTESFNVIVQATDLTYCSCFGG